MKFDDFHRPIRDNKFSKEKNNILFTMERKRGGRKVDNYVVISMLYYESQEKYFLNIDSESIKDHAELSKYFVSADEFFEEMVENFDSVVLQNEGVIKIYIHFGKTRKREITLKGIPAFQWTNLMKQIADLKKVNNYQSKELQKLKYEVKQLRATRDYVENLKQEIITLWEQLKSEQSKVEEKEEEEEQDEGEQEDWKQKLERYHIIKLVPLSNHAPNKRFELNKYRNTITKISKDSQWHNFVFQESVKPGEQKKIIIAAIQQSSKNQFQVGVISKQLLNKPNTFFSSQQQFTFKMDDKLFCTGLQKFNISAKFDLKKGNIDLKRGSIVCFTANLQLNCILVYVYQNSNLIKIIHYDIPQTMEIKQLYFFVSICKPGETLMILS